MSICAIEVVGGGVRGGGGGGCQVVLWMWPVAKVYHWLSVSSVAFRKDERKEKLTKLHDFGKPRSPRNGASDWRGMLPLIDIHRSKCLVSLVW